MKSRCFVILVLALLLPMAAGPVCAGEKGTCFSSSLHHTGEGMRYWYEAEDGFMQISKIPYDELGCKNCHVKSCDTCHVKETEKGCAYSIKKAQNSNTCLKCHAREKATIKMDESSKCRDVHRSAYLTCVDCHTHREIHGDGTPYKSMREPGAMDAACSNCHTETSERYPAIPDTTSHYVHNGELECNACHVSNTMNCYNCHFGVLEKTKSKPKSFAAKVKDFLLLVKYQGKVTSGNFQTLVGKNNEPYISYVPFFTHSITKNARKCESCHGTEAAKTLAEGKELKGAIFENNTLTFRKGVIPLVPELLKWPFLEKKDGKWVAFDPETPPLVQLGVYAEPFTQDELDALYEEQFYEE
ncbi:MAG: hypothetical protein R6V54_05050 [Desulfobacteraceae bacterium]